MRHRRRNVLFATLAICGAAGCSTGPSGEQSIDAARTKLLGYVIDVPGADGSRHAARGRSGPRARSRQHHRTRQQRVRRRVPLVERGSQPLCGLRRYVDRPVALDLAGRPGNTRLTTHHPTRVRRWLRRRLGTEACVTDESHLQAEHARGSCRRTSGTADHDQELISVSCDGPPARRCRRGRRHLRCRAVVPIPRSRTEGR